jgi:site-specific recombinase XerD
LIERYFNQPAVLNRMRDGIMSPYLDTLAVELEAQHYSRKSIRRQLRNSDAFGRWLAEQKIPLSDVTEPVVARYTEPMHRCPGPSRIHGYRAHNSRGLPRLIELLRRQGAMPAPVQTTVVSPSSGAEHWLAASDQHLEHVAGVAPSTRKNCLGFARSLLQATFGRSDPDWSQMRAEHVAAFVQTRAATRAPTCRKDPGDAVLVFLRFLSSIGLVPEYLQYAVPRVRQWTHAALPRFLTTNDLSHVLALASEQTPQGLRNRAMLLLLARLGLRAGEAIRLQLDDIDWRAGNILIRAGKTRRERILPLPQDAGEALVRYLKEGRPTSLHRRVFLNLCPPHEPLASSVILTGIAQAKLREAGISSHRPGAYVFRHYAAMHLLQSRVDIAVIALWLGHESIETTHGYLEADLKLKEKALQKLAPAGQAAPRFQADDPLLAFLKTL